jgi:hypothetical protein
MIRLSTYDRDICEPGRHIKFKAYPDVKTINETKLCNTSSSGKCDYRRGLDW